jgi:hypothetical protein
MADERYVKYEREKRKLQEMDLTPEEYERLIREIAQKLKI